MLFYTVLHNLGSMPDLHGRRLGCRLCGVPSVWLRDRTSGGNRIGLSLAAGLDRIRARLRITELEVFMTMVWFLLAAIGELVGCFAVWTWLRQGRSPFLLLLGTASLLFFAWCLTRTPVALPGRAFAAYAGVYLVGALAWMMAVDRVQPDRWDLLGGTLALLGAFLIVYWPRATTTL